MKNYIFIGDSLTYGYGVSKKDNWVTQLKNNLNGNILNKGVNGNTTTDMLFRFTEDVISNNPNLVFIMGGTNDLLTSSTPNKIINNIELMIKEALEKTTEIIIGIPPSIIPTDANRLFMPSPHYNYCNEMLPILRNELIKLCNSYKVKFIDFYTETKNTDNNIFSDGIHLNPLGQSLLYKCAKEVLEN